MSYFCEMSIQITVRASGLNLTASLKDSALSSIIKLIQDERDVSIAEASSASQSGPQSPLAESLASPLAGSFSGPNSEASIKEWLKGHGAAELLNKIRWESYSEKILLLGAWHEARGGNSPWRSSDMDETFKQAKEKAPGNFPRDIKTAIRSGLIHAETPRTYAVTRTGWNKIGQAIETVA
jgi:hypothetical protein